MKEIDLSLVIPVFNEEESLAELLSEIQKMLQVQGWVGQILFVDDGSTDQSWSVITQLSQQHAEVQGIHFRRNFGKAAALRAGFSEAKGRFVATLDADLQDDPGELPLMIQLLDEQQKDVISGWKQTRHDPWHKVFPSRVFNGLVSWLTNVKLHDHNCGMKVYRQQVVKELKLYGEMHRFIPVLARARGFQIGEKAVQHRPRKFGHSKYGVKRFLKGLIDLFTVRFLTRYGQRPAHILGSVGLGLLGLSAVLFSWDLLHTILWQLNVQLPRLEGQTILAACSGIGGVNLLAIGLATEAVVQNRWENHLPYVIDATTIAAADIKG